MNAVSLVLMGVAWGGIITFDDWDFPYPGLPSYSEQGVVFYAVGPGNIATMAIGPHPSEIYAVPVDRQHQLIRADLPQPTYGVSVTVKGNHTGPLLLEAYDAQDQLVGFATGPPNVFGAWPMRVDAPEISYAVFGGGGRLTDDDQAYADDFAWGADTGWLSVPEPGGLWMMALGLIGWVCWRGRSFGLTYCLRRLRN